MSAGKITQVTESGESADINVELPELSVEAVSDFVMPLLQTTFDSVINGYAWIPAAVIIAGLFVGAVARRIFRPRLMTLVDRWNIPFRLNRGLKNITKLILPVIALFIIILGQTAISAALPLINTGIMAAAVKLLIAWIFIRIFAQLIENTFIRQAVALLAWIIAALSILGIMDSVTAGMDAIGMDFGEFRLSVLTIVKFIFALFILLTVTSLLARAAERSLNKYSDLTPSARVLLVKSIKILLITLAILIGLTSAGIDLSALAIFGGALGLGIGFGLQKVVSNLFSGMLLLMDKSIKPGDIIELPDNEAFGWVGQLGARYVSIITRDNKEYLIPNEDFITQPVINWSYTNRLIRIETKFGVSYKSDPHIVKELAEATVINVNRVVPDPKPVCHLVEFGDSSLNFVLRYWIEDAEKGVTNTKGAAMLALWDIFKENNIDIPFPHRVIIQDDTLKPKQTGKK